ncbi:rhythmically expressed gene 2 protein-like [Plodia interpunctella]|uniref:rhythmically expressed gene 2 protein-like n=1 Tax=Plodia interpunctella TaxID=58824 RepID=UPI002368EC0C|nr:rhythmically expressed gene 2 protein-like [Plodia interpunctella]
MSISGLKLITFDATNTLLKFRILPWHYYALIAKNYGFNGTEKDVKDKLLDSYKFMWEKYPNFGKGLIHWNKWWEKVVERTFEGQLPKGAEAQISKILIEEFKTSKLWCVAEGGRQLLNILGRKSINAGVISNFDPRLRDILKSVGILSHFHFVLTSYEVGCCKPDKKIFDIAMSRCGITSPSECLHIGDDMKKDYEAAISAGWRALIVNSDNPLASKSETPPNPEHLYPDLTAVANAIQKCEVKLT